MIDLYNDDCLNVMKNIKDKSVDLIIADPPYGISKKSNFKSFKSKKFNCYNIDFGQWDHNDINLNEVVKQCYRILKNSGTFICFYGIFKITELNNILDKNNFKQIRFIEWIKNNPVPVNCQVNYLTNAREIALVGVKGSKPTFNARYHNGIFRYPICQKDRIHPTQKNVDLIKELIEIHSNSGDTVLDPCMGGQQRVLLV